MAWDRATLALSLFAIDPNGLGGVIVRARCGPVRTAFEENLTRLEPPLVRLHPGIDDDTLFGGIDLTATLSAGKLVFKPGVLNGQNIGVLTMAERCDTTLAARLAVSLDDGRLHGLIALDEGAEEEEQILTTLRERCAFHVSLDCGYSDVGLLMDAEAVAQGRARLARTTMSDKTFEEIVMICHQLGIHSARAAIFALRAAKAHAAFQGRPAIISEDIECAAALCLAHRATRMPEAPTPDDAEAPPPDAEGKDDEPGNDLADLGLLDDRVLEAVLAALPDGLLDQIKPKRAAGRGAGAGSVHRGNRRGRPKPSRPGRLSGRNRLDLVATLRSAAPWQKLRGAERGRIKVTASDFRIKQFEEKSDRLLIFTVDASGSAAIARLAEAKGAIELLLADAYSRRDHVCLVSFRGNEAETLLPPTRSLVQTKKRLAALPGGGGTPLAAGLFEALTLSANAKGQGMSPCIVLLTDGRANIALDGTADRTKAGDDAQTMARHICAAGAEAIVLDLGKRPAAFLSDLASQMNGLYLPLPRADAHKVSRAVSGALEG